MTPRCIHMDGNGNRCRNKASKRTRTIFLCSRCATPFELTMVEDQYSEATRHLLAYAAWDTLDEGQTLIDQRRVAAGGKS
jgi:hypothetical protein